MCDKKVCRSPEIFGVVDEIFANFGAQDVVFSVMAM